MRLKIPIKIYGPWGDNYNRRGAVYSAISGYASRFPNNHNEWSFCAATTQAPIWSIKKSVPYTQEFPDDSDIFYLVLCGLK